MLAPLSTGDACRRALLPPPPPHPPPLHLAPLPLCGVGALQPPCAVGLGEGRTRGRPVECNASLVAPLLRPLSRALLHTPPPPLPAPCPLPPPLCPCSLVTTTPPLAAVLFLFPRHDPEAVTVACRLGDALFSCGGGYREGGRGSWVRGSRGTGGRRAGAKPPPSPPPLRWTPCRPAQADPPGCGVGRPSRSPRGGWQARPPPDSPPHASVAPRGRGQWVWGACASLPPAPFPRRYPHWPRFRPPPSATPFSSCDRASRHGFARAGGAAPLPHRVGCLIGIGGWL